MTAPNRLFDNLRKRARQAEYALATAAYLDPRFVRENAPFVEPEDFIHLPVREFWTVWQETEDQIRAAAESGLTAEFEARASTTDPIDAPRLAAEVHRIAFLRRALVAAQGLAKDIASGDIPAVEASITDLAALRTTTSGMARTPTDITDAFLEVLTMQSGRAVATSLPPLDAATGGLERQTLTILAGRPGMGKSTLAWQVGRQVAYRDQTCVFVSMEMSAISLWAKTVLGRASILWTDVLTGTITDDQRQTLITYAEDERRSLGERLLVHDRTPCYASDVWGLAGQYNPDLIVVDHLKLFSDRGDNEAQRQGRLSWELKQVAKRFDVPVLCIAQLNRAVEMRENKRPLLSDLRDSGEIEQNADNVIMLYRAGYYDPTVDDPRATELLIRKFRAGAANERVMLDYDLERQWFRDRSRDNAPAPRDYTI